MIKDSLVESGSVPGGIFGSHRQKVSPTGDAFSYFVSGDQVEDLCRDFGCSTASYYAWKKKYGDTNPDEARRLLGQNGLA